MDASVLHAGWPGIRVDSPLTGGARTEAWSGTWKDRRVVVRRSRRTPDSRAWEWTLLQHLSRLGIGVPSLHASTTGDFDMEGWHVYDYIVGDQPSIGDPRLSNELARVHYATFGWQQRPGCASASDLLTETRGGDIDLTRMPTELVDVIRQSWRAALNTRAVSAVVHGDGGPRNALIDRDGQCVLIDWDEARVDDPVFDAPTNDAQRHALLAWEVATCWTTEPEYARSLVRRLTG